MGTNSGGRSSIGTATTKRLTPSLRSLLTQSPCQTAANRDKKSRPAFISVKTSIIRRTAGHDPRRAPSRVTGSGMPYRTCCDALSQLLRCRITVLAMPLRTLWDWRPAQSAAPPGSPLGLPRGRHPGLA